LILSCYYSFFLYFLSFFFNAPATPEIYTLSLHDALPISLHFQRRFVAGEAQREKQHVQNQSEGDNRPSPIRNVAVQPLQAVEQRSEEHTSELQSRSDLVCRLLLEKKKKK